ncbi:unnamed protein product [Boreogadus saida]
MLFSTRAFVVFRLVILWRDVMHTAHAPIPHPQWSVHSVVLRFTGHPANCPAVHVPTPHATLSTTNADILPQTVHCCSDARATPNSVVFVGVSPFSLVFPVGPGGGGGVTPSSESMWASPQSSHRVMRGPQSSDGSEDRAVERPIEER